MRKKVDAAQPPSDVEDPDYLGVIAEEDLKKMKAGKSSVLRAFSWP